MELEDELVINVRILAELVRSIESYGGGWFFLAAAVCQEGGIDMSDVLSERNLDSHGGDPLGALRGDKAYAQKCPEWPKQVWSGP